MTNYFANVNTVEQVKNLFRELAMQHHPDRGGDVEIMKEINRQYHEALKWCEGQQSDPQAKPYSYKADVETELQEKLFELLKLRGLVIVLIGYWIWVSGDTKPNKAALKAAGLEWHTQRQCWYYKPKGWKRSRQSRGSLKDLARKYGAESFQTADREMMPAVR